MIGSMSPERQVLNGVTGIDLLDVKVLIIGVCSEHQLARDLLDFNCAHNVAPFMSLDIQIFMELGLFLQQQRPNSAG